MSKNPMPHEEAEQTKAVESYLLNELTEEERSRFEEHYFECTICADAVMAGQIFIKGIRPAESWGKRLAERLTNPVPVPSWRLWAMGATVAASLSVLTFQSVNSPPIAMANTTVVASGDEKSAGGDAGYGVRTPSTTIEVDLYGKQQFPFYRMTVSRLKTAVVSQVLPAPGKQSGRRLSLQVAAKVLGTGAFTVMLAGLERRDSANPQPLGTYHFQIASASK